MFTRAIFAVAFAAIGTTAYAQAGTPGVDQRQANQAARIERGIDSGALNAREAGRLEAGQARIERMEGRAKADGVVTGRERARLHDAQDLQSRRIYRQKHDRQRAR
jgi:hypothetical protein